MVLRWRASRARAPLLICKITRKWHAASVTPCTHEINEYKQNRLPLETSSAKFSATTIFVVQLVFAPHFKQRHIPRYKNDNNRKTHVESTRAMTRERGARAESKNCEILLFPTADRRFDTKVKCPTGRASFWVKFPTVRSLTRVKCPRIARGWGDGRFWN